MRKTFNGTFTVEVEQGEIDTCLRCYSYGVLILQRHYRFYKMLEDLTIYDMRYYSQTTRIHQGIARAIDSYYTAHNGNVCELIQFVFSSRSLRELKNIFGYISINK